MTKKTTTKNRIPEFKSIEEEAAFWDTHDITDFIEDTAPVAIATGPELGTRITLRLDREDRAALDRHARAVGIGPSTLIRIWIKERLRKEAS